MKPEEVLDRPSVPDRDHVETLDVRELPPPEPLKQTVEGIESLDGGVLVQVNDRTPQHLFPKLTDRGYDYESMGDGPVYTAIWDA